MDATEYMAFVPLLIYGIALADLLSEWKRFFSPDELYFPYLLFTIILTEAAVYNIFIYVSLVNELPGQTYIRYLSFLVPPFLFLMVTNIFTPERGEHTRDYFEAKIPVVFSLMAVFIASHFLYEMAGNPWIRIIMIILLAATAVFRKHWLMYLIGLFWAVSLVLRSTEVTT